MRGQGKKNIHILAHMSELDLDELVQELRETKKLPYELCGLGTQSLKEG